MKVEPIKSLNKIEEILAILEQNIKLKLLFLMSISNDISINELLNIKIKDLIDYHHFEELTLKINQKEIKLKLNKEVKNCLDNYFNSSTAIPEHYLFKSRKGKNYPLSTHAVMNYVKSWCSAVNLEGNFGAGSLRKTYMFHHARQ